MSLSVNIQDIQEILNANIHDPETFPLHLIDTSRGMENQTTSESTYISNSWEEAAFAGWTYKHTDLNHLLSRLEDEETPR